MGKDYYTILGLTRDAIDRDIKRAYRRLALKYHPIKIKTQTSEENFFNVSEAYDVLSDPQKKAVYDQFGEEGLKGGVTTNAGSFTEPYTFSGNVDDIFQAFFGTNNPFQDLSQPLDDQEAESRYGPNLPFASMKGHLQPKKDPVIEKPLPLTLEELFHGCTKKIKISRKVLNEDMLTTSVKDKILTINVKRGWKEGTRVTFIEEGDQGPNVIPADLVFVVQHKPHPHFRRDGDTLQYLAVIPLVTALSGGNINLLTIDGRQIMIPINEIVTPGKTKVVSGEGMPLSNDPTTRGDLVIEFSIQFPTSLNMQQKQSLKQILH